MLGSKENGRNNRWWYKRGSRKAGFTVHQLFMYEISIRFLLLYIPQPRWPIDPNALSTLMCFQKYSLSLSSKTHRSIRVHTTDLMRFRLSRQKRKKTIALLVVT